MFHALHAAAMGWHVAFLFASLWCHDACWVTATPSLANKSLSLRQSEYTEHARKVLPYIIYLKHLLLDDLDFFVQPAPLHTSLYDKTYCARPTVPAALHLTPPRLACFQRQRLLSYMKPKHDTMTLDIHQISATAVYPSSHRTPRNLALFGVSVVHHTVSADTKDQLCWRFASPSCKQVHFQGQPYPKRKHQTPHIEAAPY